MATVRCPICQGEYDTILEDGTEYYHRCPPLPAVALRRADGTRVSQVGRRLVEVTEDPLTKVKTVKETFEPPLPAGATFLQETTLERPDARDENVFPIGVNKGQPKKPGPKPITIQAAP